MTDALPLHQKEDAAVYKTGLQFKMEKKGKNCTKQHKHLRRSANNSECGTNIAARKLQSLCSQVL